MKIKLAFIALLLFCTIWMPRLIAGADLDVNINLPLVEIQEEPEMAVIQGTNIYYIYGNNHDYFFYGGYWWRLHENRWYRAHHYNGTWKHRKNKYVPAPFFKLSPTWRTGNSNHSPIKYQDMKENWKKWDKEKHWDNKQNKKEDKHEPKKDKKRSGHGRK
ncbi:MAG: hypothetical protein K9N06_13250 [Candidatus Cloacimonetes bacterium]|nr:hypothetical protein [Candidatus Cloacimonadota bacterium]